MPGAAGRARLAALALAWGRALGEFGATLMFAGSFSGVTQTVPLAIYADFADGLRRRAGALGGAGRVSAALLLVGQAGRAAPGVGGVGGDARALRLGAALRRLRPRGRVSTSRRRVPGAGRALGRRQDDACCASSPGCCSPVAGVVSLRRRGLARHRARRRRGARAAPLRLRLPGLRPVRAPERVAERRLRDARRRAAASAASARGELLERFGLGERCATRGPATLSGGERQRVALARALAARAAGAAARRAAVGARRRHARRGRARELARACWPRLRVPRSSSPTTSHEAAAAGRARGRARRAARSSRTGTAVGARRAPGVRRSSPTSRAPWC